MNATAMKEALLKRTNNGLHYFLKRHPDFWLPYRFGIKKNLDSEFHNEKGTLSIFFNHEKGKWFFKDHGGQEYFGDMFSYACFLYNLDYKKDFLKALLNIQEEMKDYQPPSFNTYKLQNNDTGEYLVFFE